jgi:hypothetical protein
MQEALGSIPSTEKERREGGREGRREQGGRERRKEGRKGGREGGRGEEKTEEIIADFTTLDTLDSGINQKEKCLDFTLLLILTFSPSNLGAATRLSPSRSSINTCWLLARTLPGKRHRKGKLGECIQHVWYQGSV